MKRIKDFEELYAVTREGRVWSYPKTNGTSPRPGFFLKELPLKDSGYLRVCLTKNKKRYWRYIHRLVALSYLPKIDGHNIVNHKDGVKTNNLLTNIEWSTHSKNLHHAFNTKLNKLPKLTKIEVNQIVKLYEKGNIMQSQLAKQFRTTQQTISKIINKKAYTWQL